MASKVQKDYSSMPRLLKNMGKRRIDLEGALTKSTPLAPSDPRNIAPTLAPNPPSISTIVGQMVPRGEPAHWLAEAKETF